MYKKLLGVLVEQGYKKVLLDTPAVAVKSHHFCEKAGFAHWFSFSSSHKKSASCVISILLQLTDFLQTFFQRVNACAENFFSLLKTELLYLQEFTSIEHFIKELHEYIEWYNTKRIKLKLDGMSPVEFRLKAA